MTASVEGITKLLRAWGEGDQESLDKLTPVVYAELKRKAHQYMLLERSDHTLQTTALVNEVYLRLVDFHKVHWKDRAHFFAVCARLMRRILTDLARSRHSLKRDREFARTDLDAGLIISRPPRADLLLLDAALDRLATLDPRKGQVVELRFFGGLSVKESAEVLKVSEETVMRDWKLAKAWLLREMKGAGRDGA